MNVNAIAANGKCTLTKNCNRPLHYAACVLHHFNFLFLIAELDVRAKHALAEPRS